MQDLTPLERLAQVIAPGTQLLQAWPLAGGVSGQVTAFEVQNADGSTERFVVCRHGARDLAREPEIAAHEFSVLKTVRAAGVRAPAPRYVDAAGEFFGTPCIVLEFVDGASDEAPDDQRLVDELANELAAIHRVDIDGLSFLRRLEQADTPVLLHGDFWPGNALWKDGRLVAIVDWEDAAIGDPLADVANARLELLWARGAEAMHTFTRRYAALTGVDLAHLPRWDLWADRRLTARISEWGLDDATQSDMLAKRETFVAQARAAS